MNDKFDKRGKDTDATKNEAKRKAKLKPKTNNLVALVALAVLVTLAFSSGLYRAHGQGTAFTYQGRLIDNGILPDGNYDLRFAVFDALSAGNQVGAALTNAPLAVSNGLFTVVLDFGAGIFTGPARWLEIGVRTNGSAGDYTTLTPRQAITAVPYAITAGDVTGANIARLNVPNTAKQASGYPMVTSGFITGATVTSGGSGYVTPPSVTVNDASGSGAVITASVSGGSVTSLTVVNAGSGYSSGATLTIGPPPSNANQTFVSTNFFTSANAFSGVVNFNSASGPPFTVASATKVNNLNADLVDGLPSSAFAATNHTHFGQRWFGEAFTGGEDAGLWITVTNNGEFIFGVIGEVTNMNTLGIGVLGKGGYYGVSGYSLGGDGVHGGSSDGTGVYGSSSTGTGVYGTSSGASAIYGNNTSSAAGYVGVYGYGPYGVEGVSPNDIGVYAQNLASNTVAYLATPGKAADLYGDVWINGDLHVPSGNKYFTIDHPLDPANKYLNHVCVESTDMKNIYDGVVVLDDKGEAQIELPKWFGALNKDFRYQLTSIGSPAPNLHVARKVEGNRFSIAGGVAGQEVSWQLTGIRKDAWANAHPIRIEEDKPVAERGSYLAPEEHGQSKDKGVQWARYPATKGLLKKEQAETPATKQLGGAQ